MGTRVTVPLTCSSRANRRTQPPLLADITRLLGEGKLTHLVGPRCTLEQTAEAHRAVEGGAVGSVILELA